MTDERSTLEILRDTQESVRASTAMVEEIRENYRKTFRYAKIVAVECFVLGLLLGSLAAYIALTH